MLQRHVIDITTDGAGAATVYSTQPANGRVVSVRYIKTDFSDGVDFAVTGRDSGINIWTEENVNAAKTVAPRQPTHTQAGVAITYDGTRPVHDDIVLAGELIKVIIAAGGAAKIGQLVIITA